MPEFEPKIVALIAEITAAFDGVSREDGVMLHEAAGFDDYYYSGDVWVANRAKDTDTRWQDVPGEWIAEMGLGDVALSYYDPKGFRYYIPAYIIWMLSSWIGLGVGGDTEDAIVYSLMVQYDGSVAEKDLARFSTLNAQQSTAVAHFMEFLATQNPESNFGGSVKSAQKAINAYWGQFL